MLIEFAIFRDKQTVFSVFQSTRFCLLSHKGSFSSGGGRGSGKNERLARGQTGKEYLRRLIFVLVTGMGKNCDIQDGRIVASYG